ncbi:unnamed protein product [Ceutorhynchus assimilis]|uniref:Uncharacterized protein n=1 Tax=Ceutorhynchus assimilis TaxID=467358 RepID=A0A9N9MXL4_9CUCU|nr:unnamed protein product [Ceutorhynchus assimilis]
MDKSTQTDFDQCYCAVTRFSQPPSTSPNQQEPPNSGGVVRLRYKRTVSKKCFCKLNSVSQPPSTSPKLQQSPKVVELPLPLPKEDWLDWDTNEPTYDPTEYVLANPILRSIPPKKSKSFKKKFREEERRRFEKFSASDSDK